MRVESLLQLRESDAAEVRDRVRRHFGGDGWRETMSAGNLLEFARGSALRRLFSIKVEYWPTVARVSVAPIDPNKVGVVVVFVVQSGLHPVGRLDQIVLDAECKALETFLQTGERTHIANLLAPLRRPVDVAVVLNMVLAAGLVIWVGALSHFSIWIVMAAAILVATLDGIVIRAFADLLLEGSEKVHQVARSSGPTIAKSASTRES